MCGPAHPARPSRRTRPTPAPAGGPRCPAFPGPSEPCAAPPPPDRAGAPAALAAPGPLLGLEGERTVPGADFHGLPGERPQQDTVTRPGELIPAVDLPPPA